VLSFLWLNKSAYLSLRSSKSITCTSFYSRLNVKSPSRSDRNQASFRLQVILLSGRLRHTGWIG